MKKKNKLLEKWEIKIGEGNGKRSKKR